MITMTITLKFVISITMMITGDNHHDYKVVLISGLIEQFCAQVNQVLIWSFALCSSSDQNTMLALTVVLGRNPKHLFSIVLHLFQCPSTLVSLWAQTFKYWQALIFWRDKTLFWQLVGTSCDIQVIVKHKMQRRKYYEIHINEQIWKRVLWNTHNRMNKSDNSCRQL